ncbi:hypothetical protein BLA14095_03176 [Burkholderia lata]|uniref:hypothetical protein n=1 Tax=Burkholderia lata (strain ATCC 17760 / DSM 23089 / LMG 22485 / NCIMB 9086 / R18194 / 383) TaxID=482957 RepID=UPI0014546402|nr:hypothetical protein [Burkholderia lata]VWB69803.1 hypothetical protein BLA14095_03176 [Burkholderia lata]
MSQALHYPTIEFNDIDALKRALLVWDRIHRIVPAGYQPKDQSEILTAVQSGAVMNLSVNAQEKSLAAQRFLDFHSIRNDAKTLLTWPAGFSTETFTRINPEKIDAKLLPLFEQLTARLTADGFLEVPHELAGGYMFYLATSIAEQRSLNLTTDSSDYWAVGTYFANDGCFTEQVYDEHANSYLANLAIDDLLPNDLSLVDVDKLLRFREDTCELRKNFQDELESLRDEISRCNNKEHARYIVQDFVKRFEKAKDEYRKTLGFFRKVDVCSLFSVGVPAAAAIIALPTIGGGDPYDPLRIGVGVLIGAVAALATREMSYKPKSIASYLVDAERLTRTPNFLLHRKFEEFIND